MPIQSRVALRPNRSAGQPPSREPITVPYSAEAMATPCSSGLSPQSAWMVFSAPEITTVSKPKRNPASAEVSDQKKMRPFIRLEVCERGTASLLRQRIAFLAPVADSAVHRNHIGVTHLLQVVSGQRGTETTAAIEDHLRVEFRYTRFDVALDDALAEVNGVGKMIFREFTFFAYVDQYEFVSAIHPRLDRVDIGLAHARLGVVHNLQEARRMLVGHENSLSFGD